MGFSSIFSSHVVYPVARKCDKPLPWREPTLHAGWSAARAAVWAVSCGGRFVVTGWVRCGVVRPGSIVAATVAFRIGALLDGMVAVLRWRAVKW